MSEIEYVTAWRRNDPTLCADAKAFWAALNLMTPDEAAQRVNDLCSMAYAGGKLVGVSTVAFQDFPMLRSRFAWFRCAVAPDFRRRYLATFLTRHTLSTMEAWSLDNPEEQIQGIAAILQASELGSKAVHPQWADWNVHLNLAAYTAAGEQVRVAWFRHAQLSRP